MTEEKTKYIIKSSYFHTILWGKERHPPARRSDGSSTYNSIETMKNMMILRTNSLEYGAAAVLFPEFLKEVAETIQDDLILLPSSIHEWIVFPRKQFEYDSDLDHIKEVVGIENISIFSKSTKKSPKQEVPQNSLSQ